MFFRVNTIATPGLSLQQPDFRAKFYLPNFHHRPVLTYSQSSMYNATSHEFAL